MKKQLLGLLSLVVAFGITGCKKNDDNDGGTKPATKADVCDFAASEKDALKSYFDDNKIITVQIGDSGLTGFKTAFNKVFTAKTKSTTNPNGIGVDFFSTLEEKNAATTNNVHCLSDSLVEGTPTHIDIDDIPNDYLVIVTVGMQGKGMSTKESFLNAETTHINALVEKIQQNESMKCVYFLSAANQIGKLSAPYIDKIVKVADYAFTLDTCDNLDTETANYQNYFTGIKAAGTGAKVCIQSTTTKSFQQLAFLAGR